MKPTQLKFPNQTMGKYYFKPLTSFIGNKPLIVLVPALLMQLIFAPHFSYARSDDPDSDIHISYTNNLLNISAEKAKLKNVYSMLANKTDIDIFFPSSLNRTVSIDKKGISLKQAVKDLSKGLNTLIIYSGPDKKKASISKVFVLKRQRMSERERNTENRILGRIKAYERQRDALNRNLSRVTPGSPRAKRYTSRINRLEQNIQRLQNQL